MMSRFYYGFLCFLIVGHTETLCFHLPSIFKPCKITDNACLKKNMEYAISNLSNGVKEMGIPGLEPVLFDEVIIQSPPGPTSLYQKFTGNRLSGFIHNPKVKQFEIDLKECKISFEVLFPKIRTEGHYYIKGQLLFFRIDTEDEYSVEAENLVLCHMKCEITKTNEDDHLRIVDAKVNLTISNVHFQMGEIIKGNKQLSAEFEDMINRNPSLLLSLAKNDVQKAFEISIQQATNNIFSNIPLKEIFIDVAD